MDTNELYWTVVEQRLFTQLCKDAGKKQSQRDIANKLGVSPTAIANAVTRLGNAGVVTRERMKTINLITLHRENATPLHRVENLKRTYTSGLAAHLEEQFPGSTIILFGSYARGEDTHQSDIDIAVIGRQKKKVDLTQHEEQLQRTINIQFFPDWNITPELRNNIINGIVLFGSVDI